MKKIWMVGIVLIFNVAVYAQTTSAKVTRQVAKVLVEKPTVSAGTLSYYGGARGGMMGVDYYLQRKAASQIQSIPAQRSWLEQQKRNWKAAQLKKQRHQQQFQALKAELDQQELELAKAALPPLVEAQKFQVNDFNDFVPVARQQPKPAVPYAAELGTIAYRGLALASDGNSVRNILKNGLRLQDAGEENSTLRLAYASHGGYDAMRFFLENPVTNLTYGPNSASSWGARRLSNDLPILTLVKVRGSFDGSSLEVATEDIPASQIEELAVRLNLNGNLTWCKVTLEEDDTFILTPYEPFYELQK